MNSPSVISDRMEKAKMVEVRFFSSFMSCCSKLTYSRKYSPHTRNGDDDDAADAAVVAGDDGDCGEDGPVCCCGVDQVHEV